MVSLWNYIDVLMELPFPITQMIRLSRVLVTNAYELNVCNMSNVNLYYLFEVFMSSIPFSTPNAITNPAIQFIKPQHNRTEASSSVLLFIHSKFSNSLPNKPTTSNGAGCIGTVIIRPASDMFFE